MVNGDTLAAANIKGWIKWLNANLIWIWLMANVGDFVLRRRLLFFSSSSSIVAHIHTQTHGTDIGTHTHTHSTSRTPLPAHSIYKVSRNYILRMPFKYRDLSFFIPRSTARLLLGWLWPAACMLPHSECVPRVHSATQCSVCVYLFMPNFCWHRITIIWQKKYGNVVTVIK